jgi:ATP-dependent Clp protease ATP-binding subunit ClpA
VKTAKWLVAYFLCGLALTMVGCTTSQLATNSYKTLTAAESIVGEAAKQFPQLDREHRAQIVARATSEADGVAKLAAWDVTADRLQKAIAGTDATVKMCRDGIADVRAGLKDKSQLAGWIAAGIRLGLDLSDLLASVGVPLMPPTAAIKKGL